MKGAIRISVVVEGDRGDREVYAIRHHFETDVGRSKGAADEFWHPMTPLDALQACETEMREELATGAVKAWANPRPSPPAATEEDTP